VIDTVAGSRFARLIWRTAVVRADKQSLLFGEIDPHRKKFTEVRDLNEFDTHCDPPSE
jgi:predicted 2-oxoglutarate/Fe(II)-dependent dioxygenase YbiX